MAASASASSASASAPSFASTRRFKEAVAIINGVDHAKWPALLVRIVAALTEEKASMLTEEEEAQAKEMLALSQAALNTLLDASSYLFEQCAYHNVSDEKLPALLLASGLSDDHARGFQTVWTNHKDALLEKLSQRTLGAPQVLSAVHWRLHLAVGHQAASNMKDVSAIFNFKLTEQRSGDDQATENVTVELDDDHLREFYHKLETIQSQLDALS